MKGFFGLLQKEFYHIFRDRRTLAILFGMPVIQLLLFGFVIRNEISEVRLGICDLSRDAETRRIADKLCSGDIFVSVMNLRSPNEIGPAFASGKLQEAIVFEPGFASRLDREGKGDIQIITDGSDPNVSRIITGYTETVIRDYRMERNPGTAVAGVVPVSLMMFNPSLKSVYLFVPGLMALILMLVSALMTSISIAREKESGTMEILLVSTLRPYQIIIGKVAPYMFLAFINAMTVLLLAFAVFGVPCRGSFALLVLESLLFIITALSLGILISTITSSQQAAMMISLGGLLLPTILLSGFIFPIASMPIPLQVISNIIPARWYLVIVRAIMLKGADFGSLWKETLMLVFMTCVFMTASIRKFSIRLQ
jgi:ABC-2 type transport system permease protein